MKQRSMSALDNIQEIRKKSITVGFLADEGRDRFDLQPLNGGVGRDKLITDKNLHRPQLALTGYTKLYLRCDGACSEKRT